MANVALGFPNYADVTTFTKGAGFDWSVTLANLANGQIAKKARSLNLTLAETMFDWSMASSKKIRLLALAAHNLSIDARYRMTMRSWTRPSRLEQGNSSMAVLNNIGAMSGSNAWLTASASSNSGDAVYAEVTITVGGTIVIGASNYVDPYYNTYVGSGSGGFGYRSDGMKVTNGVAVAYGDPYTTGDVVGVLYDVQLKTLTFYKNGVSQGVAFSGSSITGLSGMMISAYNGTERVYYNNGDAAFAYPVPSPAVWYDSSWQDVWPTVYPIDTLEWEDENWWTGKYTDEALKGVNWNRTHILPSNVVARFGRVEISDATNTAGYVEIGRFVVGPLIQTRLNMSRNSSLAYETDTAVEQSLSGAEFFDVRTPYRVVQFALDWMTTDEGLVHMSELMRRAGVDKDVYFILDPDDTEHALRRQFLGRLRRLSSLEFPYFNVTKIPVEGKEKL